MSITVDTVRTLVQEQVARWTSNMLKQNYSSKEIYEEVQRTLHYNIRYNLSRFDDNSEPVKEVLLGVLFDMTGVENEGLTFKQRIAIYSLIGEKDGRG